MISYILSRKPRITPSQKSNRLQWCYEHLDWSVKDWSNIIFSRESSYEVTYLIERNESIFVDSAMIVLGLKDGKEATVLEPGQISLETLGHLRRTFQFD